MPRKNQKTGSHIKNQNLCAVTVPGFEGKQKYVKGYNNIRTHLVLADVGLNQTWLDK